MVFEKVAEMLANHLSIEQDSIKMETTFEELGVDSLDTVEMVMDLEESLGIELELRRRWSPSGNWWPSSRRKWANPISHNTMRP